MIKRKRLRVCRDNARLALRFMEESFFGEDIGQPKGLLSAITWQRRMK